MAMDKELIYSKINKIKDPIQKVMLQDILVDIFTQLIDYNDSCFQALEERIRKEEKDLFDSYTVDTAVCKKNEFDESSRFWFEMKTEGTKREEHRLDTIFLACDFDTISDCLNRTYTAKIFMENTTETISIGFTYAQKYLDKIEWLYHQFGKNRKKWQTINCPFLYKFLDIVDIDKKIPIDAPIQKIELEMGELGDSILTDMMLVWNIEETVFETEAIKIAGEKAVQYEHEIAVSELEDGYLFILEEEESIFSILSEQSIKIRTETKPYEEMFCLHFVSYNKTKDNMNLFYPLQTNKRRRMFVDKLAENCDTSIVTLGEIRRLLSSYSVMETEGLTLEKVKIQSYEELRKESREKTEVFQLDCNPFIQIHQLWNKKMAAVFYFRIGNNQDRITKELIGFLLSELQLHLIEYRCAAKIIPEI